MSELIKSTKGVLVISLILLNTLFWFPFLLITAVLKLIAPGVAIKASLSKLAIWIAECWIAFNSALFSVFHGIDLTVETDTYLSKADWYFVNCNHQSWADIPIMQKVLNGKVPMLKFFLKQELIWVPLLGVCWWALDFPFMKRYSKAQIEAKPELAGKDLETTKKACEKFKYTPVSIFNFLEGTRFTPAKHAQQQSTFEHLLMPKAGGVAFAVSSMGERMNKMLDATIYYPQGQQSIWGLCRGDITKIVVDIRERIIPKEFFEGDYQNDAAFRERFQLWINDLWLEKDALLTSLKAKHAAV